MYKKAKTIKTKINRSVRAVSPIITVLTMIAIALVASIVAYAWVIGIIGGTSTTAGHTIQIQSTTVRQGPNQFLIIYVQNTGQGTVHLKQDSSVYVNDILYRITHSPQGHSIDPSALIEIPVGQTAEVVTDKLLTAGEHLKIKIVTVEGTVMEYTDNGRTSTSGQTDLVSDKRYALDLSVAGSGTVAKSPNQATYSEGASVQLIPSAPSGWQFDHWSGDLTGNANPGSLNMNSAKTVTAAFTQKEYALNIQIQGQGTVTKSKDGPYQMGETIQLTATPADQTWSFAGWTGDATGTNPTTQVTIDETPEVTATFVTQTTQYSLTVTPNPSNGGTVELSSQSPYASGQTVTLTPHPAAGYTFTEWAGDLTGNANPGQITLTRNMMVTAKFAPSTTTLTLSVYPPYAGSVTANPIGPYHIGDVVQLTAVPNTAFAFSTWSQDISGTTNPISITLSGNKAVTANFNSKEYPLDIQIIGQGAVAKTPDKTTYHLGDSVQLKATPISGWSFAGYTGDTTGSNNQANIIVDENPTVIASFTQQEYSLTVTSNPSAGGPVGLNNTGPIYHYNDHVELTPQPVFGYHFVSWDGDVTGTTAPATITITGNMIVTANYEANPVTLTLNVNPQNTGTINADPTGPYRFGVQAGLTAVPAAGYVFTSWSDGLTGSTNPSTITLFGDTTVTANFAKIEYPLAITISPPQGGTVTKSPNQAAYHLNTQVELTAIPANGYTFAGWTGDSTGSGTTATVTIDQTPQVTATFVQVPYSLTTTANPTSTGSITRTSQGPYYYNDKVTLTAVPASGYTFTSWSGNGLSGSTNPAQITITGNMIVTAEFTPIDVSLTLNVDPAGKGAITPNPPGPYHYGDTVQLTAVPTAGYSFNSWSGDASGTTNPITMTLNGNKIVTATFTQNPTQTLLTVDFDNSDSKLWDLGWNDWGNPPWGRATDQVSNGVASAKCIEGNHGSYEHGPFTSDPMNAQNAASITVSFDYRLSTSMNSNSFQIYYSGNPGSSYNAARMTTQASLGNSPANTWRHYTTTITNPSAFTSTFRFGFLSQNLPHNAAIWVDNISITMQIK